MKIMSKDETKAWIRSSLHDDVFPRVLEEKFPRRRAYILPGDTGKKTALARIFANVIAPEGLLWVTGYNVWPSSENMDLFAGYRRSLGEIRSLSDAPGHLFDGADISAVQSLIALCLYFFWDAVIIDASLKVAIVLSHDEYVDIYTTEKDRLNKIDEFVSKMGVQMIDRESH